VKKSEIKIYIAEGNNSLLDALKNYIINELNISVIETASSVEDIIDKPKYMNADVVILDVCISDNRGLAAARFMFCHNHRTKIIALTMNEESIHLYDLIVWGFKGVVSKDKIYSQLEEAITTVADGKLYFPKNIQIKDLENGRQ
jgi:two-component system nitrate/nitrite response regulator NarL